ncbi:MAG: Glu/Leu/Phe/Val dehydrogenase [Acidobacteria bacterium]|nr:Glu/Leu/Phe/Val dehydrogenase [Acidobacteriota bacterium]
MNTNSVKNICEIYATAEHERVVLWSDPTCNYRGIIAIHSTALGPALGGTRFWNYANDEEASRDALRLSKGMSYKNALAGLPFGGGKSVIIGDNRTTDRERIFRAHGRFIESFGGRYITAEDIGTTPSDMEYVALETRHVGGLPGRSGDPSPVTAHGVFRALQACAQHRWGTADLSRRVVALQGCGSTGYHLAREIHEAGAALVVADVDPERVRHVVSEFGAQAVSPRDILSAQADVFSPCAMGGVINDETIPALKAEIIVGSANNQLLEPRHGDLLNDLGKLYAPDYVANAGGVINGCRELLSWAAADAAVKVNAIYDTMLELLDKSKAEGMPPFRKADQLAEQRLSAESFMGPISTGSTMTP